MPARASVRPEGTPHGTASHVRVRGRGPVTAQNWTLNNVPACGYSRTFPHHHSVEPTLCAWDPGKLGRIPLFLRKKPRRSCLFAYEGTRQRIRLTLGLILTDVIYCMGGRKDAT